MTRKIQPCLWFNKNAEEAANFYAATFPDSRIDSIERAPGDSDRLRRDCNARMLQRAVDDVPALIQFAEHGGIRHEDVVEDDFAER